MALQALGKPPAIPTRSASIGVHLPRSRYLGLPKGVLLDFSRPAKPTDNSFIESFNGKSRKECLNTRLNDARQKTEDWRRDYNEVRPHRAIGNKAPISLLNGSSAPPPA